MKYGYLFVFFICSLVRGAQFDAQFEALKQELEHTGQDLVALDEKRVLDAIKTFEQSPSEMERMQAADELHVAQLRLETLKDKTKTFKPDQLRSIEAGSRYSQRLHDAVEKLERALTPTEIAFITSENPSSYFRDVKQFSLLSVPRNCTAKAYAAAMKKIGRAELLDRGPIVMALSSTYEGAYARRYCDKIVELLRRRNSETLARRYLLSCRDLDQMPDVTRYARRYETDLLAKGVKPSDLKSYVRRLAVQSPECLGTINPDFIQRVRRDTAKPSSKAR